jgi:predicted DNA-binding protein with PD1-like motif
MTNYKIKRTLIGQLAFGSDLYDGLTQIVQRENIRLGRISGIGATIHAVVAYYDQNAKKYNPLEFSGGMEILNLQGNVSIRDAKPFVHVHILLGDVKGNVFGGHLLQGTKLFACEVTIDEFEGEELVRAHDERTGLHLWKSGILK